VGKGEGKGGEKRLKGEGERGPVVGRNREKDAKKAGYERK
jgi:hypothetical protein